MLSEEPSYVVIVVRFKVVFWSLFSRIYRLLCKLIQVLSVLRIGALISSIVCVFSIFSDYIGLQEANVCHFMRCTCIVKHICIHRLCLIGIFLFFDS